MTDPDQPAGTIVVSGTGRVAVDPDVAELRLGVAIARPTVDAARAAAAEAMAAILAAVTAAGVARARRAHDAAVGPAALRLPRRQGADPDRLRPRERGRGHGPRPGHARWRGRRRADGRRDEPRRPDVPGRRPARGRNAPRGPRPSRRPVPARRSWPRRPGSAIAGVADIVEGGPPPSWPQPKAARAMLAADAGTPVQAGTTEIAVTVTVTFRIG